MDIRNPFDLDSIAIPSDEKYRLDEVINTRRNSSNKGGKYLKGPIPLIWLVTAGNLSGKALFVGIGIWFWAGCRSALTVKASSNLWRELGIGRQAVYRGLIALERAGLIKVERHVGRAPVVTLIVDATHSA